MIKLLFVSDDGIDERLVNNEKNNKGYNEDEMRYVERFSIILPFEFNQ